MSTGKGFAFLEFSTHDAARDLVSQGTVTYRKRSLTLGWGKDREKPIAPPAHSSEGEHKRAEGGVMEPPSLDCKSLFMGGLPLGSRSSSERSSALSALLPAGSVLRSVGGKGFAFVDFPSHEDAKRFLEESNGRLEMSGRALRLGWAQRGPTDRGGDGRAVESEASSCWFCLSSPHVLVCTTALDT